MYDRLELLIGDKVRELKEKAVLLLGLGGVGGLGEIVLKGITQMKIGLGFEGGIAVVILALNDNVGPRLCIIALGFRGFIFKN